MIHRRLRMGMVGGGRDAFIGAVHRMAARLDGEYEIVAGCFSSNPEKSRLSGEDLFLDPSRIYSSFEEMALGEAALPESERIDCVSIVTPNYLHFPVAKAFLEAGIHVICDKPMTLDLEEARALKTIVEETGLVFALTHNYTGYPMIKEARYRVRSGELGEILKVVVEYPQGWLLKPIDQEGHKQAEWRTDPARAGSSSCLGDIGTHAENIIHYVTGLEIEALCAEFSTFVDGRQLEDDANLLVRYKGGAKGILYASQISVGEDNNLSFRIYGSKGSIEWHQEDPNELILKFADAPRQILRRGHPYLSEVASQSSRIPPGHPEAFIEAFANVYREAARAVQDHCHGQKSADYDFPTVEDGLRGMKFLQNAVASARSETKWTPFVD